ncbi:uncharacterized protein LOC127508285 isoform X1 [Ctenopharyngodon idella]|uniref:uncharacterized protein LOC127508285 isoform X1 n=1 Tax=Ctenopharyngodon idella TaxID=7959 RepID=UPI0022303910|nr:uncharacterized protein LOC127508285 isoform X1 [Ctenopharyngodon idella]
MFPSRLVRSLSESAVENLSQLQSRVSELRDQADAEIQLQTRTFLEVAEVRLKEAQDELESLQKSSKALVEFFCEDDKSFKLEEACLIFHGFCHRFQRAARENAERKLQEQRRLARECENVQKRHSLGRRMALEAERDSCDLEFALQRSFSHTGSRRSHRHSPYIQRNMKSDRQRHPNSNLHVLSPRGVGRGSPLKGLSLRKNDVNTEETEQAQCFSTDSAVNVRRDAMASPNTMKSRSSLNTKTVSSYNASVALPETSNASHQQGAGSVLSLTGHYKKDSHLVKTPVGGNCWYPEEEPPTRAGSQRQNRLLQTLCSLVTYCALPLYVPHPYAHL